MSENELVSDDSIDGPIFSALKGYQAYMINNISIVDDDIEI
jgi:hypothetical protein